MLILENNINNNTSLETTCPDLKVNQQAGRELSIYFSLEDKRIPGPPERSIKSPPYTSRYRERHFPTWMRLVELYLTLVTC